MRKFETKKIGTQEDRNKVIERLKELNYIDDLTFAKDYIQTRLTLNPRGIWMLRAELKLKGISKDHIEKAIKQAAIDEYKYAINMLERKKRALQSLSKEKKRKKILSLLASRGFKPETIYKALDGW
jgi:regulatory protein